MPDQPLADATEGALQAARDDAVAKLDGVVARSMARIAAASRRPTLPR